MSEEKVKEAEAKEEERVLSWRIPKAGPRAGKPTPYGKCKQCAGDGEDEEEEECSACDGLGEVQLGEDEIQAEIERLAKLIVKVKPASVSAPYQGPPPDFKRAYEAQQAPSGPVPHVPLPDWQNRAGWQDHPGQPVAVHVDRASAAFDGYGEPQKAMDFAEGNVQQYYLEVDRTELGEGSEGDEGLGHCGDVEDREGWKDEIKRRFGGGHYLVKGRDRHNVPKSRKIQIPGPSRSIVSSKDDEDDVEVVSSGSYSRGGIPWSGPSPYVPPGGFGPRIPPRPWADPRAPWSPSTVTPWPPVPGAPVPPHYMPYNTQPAQPPGLGFQHPGMDELREKLNQANEIAAKEREERRIERAEAKHAQELQAIREGFAREISDLKHLLTERQGGGAMDQMIKLMTVNMQQDQQRLEREREDRRAREDREEAQRKEAERLRIEEAKREDRRRAEERQAALDRLDRQADKEREAQLRMFEYMQKQQPTQQDQINLIAALNKLAGPKKDVSQEVANWITAISAMKDVFSDDRGKSETESLVETISDKAVDVISAIKSGGSGQQQPQQPAMPGYQLPGPGVGRPATPQEIHQFMIRQGYLQAQLRAQEASVDRDPTEQEWELILDHLLDAYGDDRDPREVVLSLGDLVTNRLRIPRILNRLEGISVTMLKLVLEDTKQRVPVNSPLVEKIGLFQDLLDEDGEGAGREWVSDLLEALKAHQRASRRAPAPSQSPLMAQLPPVPHGFVPGQGMPIDPRMAGIDPRMAGIDPRMAGADPRMAAMDRQASNWVPNSGAAPPDEDTEEED